MKIKLSYMLLCFYSLFQLPFLQESHNISGKTHKNTHKYTRYTHAHSYCCTSEGIPHSIFTFIPYPLTLTLILTTAWIILTRTLKQPFVKQSKMAPAL